MPRRIILLSDGTGNSSASFWRTNVWRMFSALDLTNNDQVACYDDGVGTSSFKPLALLGGAFGVGLRRNVISLYKFACRNFRDVNDEIYAFGFSRGAFTIRVVIGLIVDQGLIPADGISETELDQQAHAAYRAYHGKHFPYELGSDFIADQEVARSEYSAGESHTSGSQRACDPLSRLVGHRCRLWFANRRNDTRRQPMAVAAGNPLAYSTFERIASLPRFVA